MQSRWRRRLRRPSRRRRSQDALCRRHLVAARAGHGLAQGQRNGLERGFRAVVIVLAAQHVDVQGEARRGGEGTENVCDVLTRESTDDIATESQVHRGVRPAGEIDYRARQRLVERRKCRSESHDTAALAQRAVERFAEAFAPLDEALARGANADPNRTIPRRWPSARSSASPRPSAQSSAVWWSSTRKSPLHAMVRSNPEC